MPIKTPSYVYILAPKRNGTLYIGVTSDLVRRVSQHKLGTVNSFSKKHNIKTLVWYEEHPDILSAIQREKQLKKWNRAWKLELIEQTNPDWVDISGQLK